MIQKIKIICPIHGIFKQTLQKHYYGGCKQCGDLIIKQKNSKNPIGWTKTNWFKTAQKSKNFDSFKVYIIKCWNDNEEFYKIGRTFKKLNIRFQKGKMPYNYTLIKTYEFKELTKENCNKCYDLETEFKQLNNKNKYIPNLKFDGMQECYNKQETIKEDFDGVNI